jgi:cell fate regulator YaaT (PSP1 superfamily)
MFLGIKNLYNNATFVYSGKNEFQLKIGDIFIFFLEEKKYVGKIIFAEQKKIDSTQTEFNGKILRKVTAEDLAKIQKQKTEAAKALISAQSRIKDLKIKMNITEARLSFDEGEINFLFTAPERVEFRDVVPVLAGLMKKRIHLQQLGARDRARFVGGFGICGKKQCCCNGAVTHFKSISMEIAKAQELTVKGSEKLSGNCGKLFCCLDYELSEYQRLRKKMPELQSQVQTSKGKGIVIGLNILSQQVKVRFDTGAMQVFDVKDGKLVN